MVENQQILEFYTQEGAMTALRTHPSAFAGCPRDPAALTDVLHGLILHEHLAFAYGVTLSDERRSEVHVRPLEQIVDRLMRPESRPLALPRTLEERIVGNCRDFTLMSVGILRANGVPARARCGFGAYFEPGSYVDHWVCEYWSAAEGRWIRVDAQIDEVQRALFKPAFDLLDVPGDCFLAAGDAWTRCRAGEAEPARFGMLHMSGLWFIAGNLVRDVAALNNMEMLPWDVWGGMPRPDEELDSDQLAFFDRVATLTADPDASFGELRALYEGDERLRVPTTVFNAVLNRPETI